MRRFFENKYTFGVIFTLFTCAFTWNNSQGAAFPAAGHLPLCLASTKAHGPTMPPDPWDARQTIAHGPTMPPDPWDARQTIAHGPTMPPDPWDARQTIG
jgi:hypothetical protein